MARRFGSAGNFFIADGLGCLENMKNRQAHLDVLRGLAALLVCAGHLRSFLLVENTRFLGLLVVFLMNSAAAW